MKSFWVDGIPATKGSWRVMRGKLLPDNKAQRPWSNAVAWMAKAAGVRPVPGPVAVQIECFYPRPKNPTNAFPSRNDVDKSARCCLDALTGIAWDDDQQVVELYVTKAYAGERGPGAWVRIKEVVPA